MLLSQKHARFWQMAPLPQSVQTLPSAPQACRPVPALQVPMVALFGMSQQPDGQLTEAVQQPEIGWQVPPEQAWQSGQVTGVPP